MASEGGALDCSEDSSATLSNCILWGNTATLAGPQICLKGCPQGTSTVDVSYSDVQGGPNEVSIESGCGACAVNWGAGNIDADPLCVDPNGPDGDPNTWEDNDYHLSPSSPCIGAGDPNGDYTGQTDIDGQPRLMGPVVDMGSDEVPLTLTVTNGTGSGTYIQDQVVAISTTVPAGTRFGQWTGDTDNVTDIYSASTTVVMKDNTTLTATFVTQYALTVHNGTGDGTYDVGLDVPIQATVPPGMAFDQWTGDVANVADVNAASTTVTMNADTTVTATFVALCTLTVTVTGQGSVTPNGGTYPAGTPVTLTATAADGWQFVNWENGATGSDLSVTVTMDTDKTVEAVFGEIGVVPQPPPLPCAAGAAPGQLAFWWCVCAIGLAAMRWRHRR